jgi:hypothetical protein
VPPRGMRTPVGDLAVTPRLLVRGNPEQPSDVVRETPSGAPATRHQPRAKTGPFPPETRALVPGGENAQDQRKNSIRSPRNPRARSGRRPTATWATRDGPTRERRRPDRGLHRGRGPRASATPPAAVRRRGGGRPWGKGHRLRSVPEEDYARRGAKGAKRGSCGIPGSVGSGGRGRHEQCGPPLFIISMAPRSGHRFRAGAIAFSPLSLHRDS